MTAPWEAWSELAGRPWRHDLTVLGAETLEQVSSLEEDAPGAYRWVRESVHRTATGLWLFVRATRTDQDGPETLELVLGANPDELVTGIRAQLGLPPGRVEVLGRAGIEIGLEPDDEIEGDELED